MQISNSANAASHGSRRRSPRRAPTCAAIGTSTQAASATRDHATKSGGTPWSTAILMKRYGMPQIRDIAANRNQARGLTPSEDKPRPPRPATARAEASAAAAGELPRRRQHARGRERLDHVTRDEVHEAV